MAEIWILRLGHRRNRDKRISTHVGLVARAFGANGIIFSGDYDENVLESIKRVVEIWGGPFEAIYEKDWKRLIIAKKEEGFIVIHLTMYGENLPDIIDEIRRLFYKMNKSLLIIVGAEKVPGIVYELADYNIAISNQPHSEVAALAVFLDWLFEGKELKRTFKDAKLKIIPCKKGKKVLKASTNPS
ncbi:MAG: tRNA (cytidine(56)-2'-O)-methyltransferase [Candidatus Njordarchaeales archaeon]